MEGSEAGDIMSKISNTLSPEATISTSSHTAPCSIHFHLASGIIATKRKQVTNDLQVAKIRALISVLILLLTAQALDTFDPFSSYKLFFKYLLSQMLLLN